MRVQFIAFVLALIALSTGCRKDAATAPPAPAESIRQGAPDANPQAAGDVTLRIRKLGGADGKQVMNEMTVVTPLDDEFTITEQVGTAQLEFRGKVLDLKDGKYRVSYQYTETSPTGRQQLKSLIEMRPGTEEELGGFQSAEAVETVVLALSRP